MRRWLALVVVLLTLAIAFVVVNLVPPEEGRVDGVDASGLDNALVGNPQFALGVENTSVVLAMVCTLRKNRLESYGHDRPTSPFMRQLSESGLTLDRHYTQAPWTRPSTGSLLTSRWPRALQLDNPGTRGSLNLVLGETHETLAERLQKAGYQTMGTTGNPNLNRQFGLAQGFDVYSEPSSTYKGKKTVEVDGNDQVDFLVEAMDGADEDRPWFLQIVLTDAHTPRQVESRYLSLFATQPGERKSRRNRYDASVRKVDAVLARLFTEVRERRPNSLFIIASDHGEGLRIPQHHGKGHGNFLYETHIGSPSIWQHPALFEPGRHFSGLTMNLDVVPTLLDLLGIDATGTIDGKSLGPWMRGKSDEPLHTSVFAETFYGRSNKRVVMSLTHQYHVNVKPRQGGKGRERLYAAEDWRAEDDLLAVAPDIAETMRNQLEVWEAEMAALAEGVDRPSEVELDPDLKSQLEALGYVQ